MEAFEMLAGRPEDDETARDEQKEIAEERKRHVKKWLDRVEKGEKHWEDTFKRMREDIDFVRGKQWPDQTDDDGRYVVNLVQRHVQQRVAALYAKNPKVIAKRKQKIDFTLWDEKPQSLMQAGQGAMMGDPNAMQIVSEVAEVRARRVMIDKIGKTLELIYAYYQDEGEPNFKLQAKQLVRRVCACGVGYMKLGYQRVMGKSPDTVNRISDFSERIAHLQRLAEEVKEGEYTEGMAELDELQSAVDVLLNEPEIILREGLVFDFPKPWDVIVDPSCVQLKGFVGANWIAHKFMFSDDEIEEIYGVSEIGKKGARAYSYASTGGDVWVSSDKSGDGCENKYRVYELYDKRTGMMLTVCEGYDDFLEEPSAPRVFMERFWPMFVLSFNDIEDERDIYPPSDARLMRHQQIEHNRAREALREHRIANRPAYAAPKGVMSEDDKDKLAVHDAHELIELAVPPGTDVKTVLQPLQKVAIDSAIYDTTPFFDDIQKSVGSQEANFGGVSGVAATEVSVAEGARLSTIQSNVDDLNDFLSEVARAGGQILLQEVSKDTAIKIAGRGAVWPEATRSEIVEELLLDIEAGSSGRPNKSYELANFERIAPTLLQIPGITPDWLAKQAIQRLDDAIDLTDAYMEGMPSIMAMNRQAQLGTGDPATDPNQQGGEGGDKNTNPQQRPQGAQPAYPTGG